MPPRDDLQRVVGTSLLLLPSWVGGGTPVLLLLLKP